MCRSVLKEGCVYTGVSWEDEEEEEEEEERRKPGDIHHIKLH